MDIKKLQPEAEVTYELETTGEPITITFRLGFIALDGILDYVNESREEKPAGSRPRISDVLRRAVAEAIYGWDLTDGDVALPCTRENKDKHLPLLFGLRVKRPEVVDEAIPVNPVASVLVMVLAEFAGTASNFLKN